MEEKNYIGRFISSQITSVFDGTSWKSVGKTLVARSPDLVKWEQANIMVQSFDKTLDGSIATVGLSMTRFVGDLKDTDFVAVEVETKSTEEVKE